MKTVQRLRATSAQSADGFTLIEVLLVVAMSSLLGIAIAASVLGSLTFLSQVQLNAVESARNEKIFTEFTTRVRNMDTLQSATGTAVSFIYRDTNSCQLHTYSLETDTVHTGRERLRHTITSVTVNGLLTCDSVTALLTGGTLSPQTNRIEASDLGTTSTFTYLDGSGQRTLRMGDTGYDAATALPLCQISGVNLTTYSRFNARANTEPDIVENLTVNIMSNARGLTC